MPRTSWRRQTSDPPISGDTLRNAIVTTASMSPPAEDGDVVREQSRQRSRQTPGVVHRGQRKTAIAGEPDTDLPKTAFFGDALQIDRKERGEVRRIIALLKRGEPLFEQQREDRQRAGLVRGGHHNPAARARDARELPHQRARMLEVFDHLHRRDGIRTGVRQRKGRVQVGVPKIEVCRPPVVIDRVDANAAAKSGTEQPPQIPPSAAHVHQQSVRRPAPLEDRLDHRVNGLVSTTEAEPRVRFDERRDGIRDHEAALARGFAVTSASRRATWDAGEQMDAARAGPADPRRVRSAGSSISAWSAAASDRSSPIGTITPHVRWTISRAPPASLVTTGTPAYSASAKTIPNGSGAVFGWHNTSTPRKRRGTSRRSPRNRTRSIRAGAAHIARSSFASASSGPRCGPPAIQIVHGPLRCVAASSSTPCPFQRSKRLAIRMTIVSRLTPSSSRTRSRSAAG